MVCSAEEAGHTGKIPLDSQLFFCLNGPGFWRQRFLIKVRWAEEGKLSIPDSEKRGEPL
jgi:hypothetical protein